MKRLFIIGGYSIASEIRDAVELSRSEYDEIFNVIADHEEECKYSFIKDSNIDDYISSHDDNFFIIGLTSPNIKNKFYDKFIKKGCIPVNIIHPSAFISKTAKLGKGIYIAAFAVISSHTLIGDGSIINFQAVIGHDSIIGKNCSINPGAKIGGNTTIEDNCLIGANSFVFQGIHIVHDTKIDALTYVRQNINVPSICRTQGKFECVRNILMNTF